MFDYNPNLWAIVGAAVVSMILGSLWYSKALFGQTWAKLSGISLDKVDKADTNRGYLIMFVGALIMPYVLTHFIFLVSPITLSEALTVGFWAWFGFVATVMASDLAFGQAKFSLFAINAGFQLVNFLVVSSILYYYA